MRLLNRTTLIKKIYRHLGIGDFKLPIDDDGIFDIIMEETLPSFSFIYPYYYNVPVADCTKLSNYRYKLPDNSLFDDCAIIAVTKLVYDYRQTNDNMNSSISGGLVNIFGNNSYDSGDIITDALNQSVSLVANDLVSFGQSPILIELEEPNVVVLSQSIGLSNSVMFKLHLTHPNLNTISNGKAETFFKLALLDVQGALYSEMKRHNYSPSAIADMKFDIDEWSDSYNERETFYEELFQATINEREDQFIVT